MHRKSLAIPAAAVLILSGTAGMGRLGGTAHAHGARDTYSGTISITDYQAPNALNGGGSYGSSEANVELGSAMGDNALGLDNKGNFYADLATQVPSTSNGGIKVVNGNEVITYHIKPNLKWSDGSSITNADWISQWVLGYTPDIAAYPGLADQVASVSFSGNDLVMTLKGVQGSALQQDLPTPSPWEYYQKKYGATVTGIDMSSYNRAKEIDPKTDLIPAGIYKSSGLQKLALANLSDHYTSPSDLFDGPYKLKSWSADQRYVLEANPYYTALPADPKHPRPAIIQDVVLSEDGPTYVQDVKAASNYNTIDEAQDFSPQNISDLKSTKYQVAVQPSLQYEHLDFMVAPTYKGQKNPMADVRVRTALNYAINKDQMLTAIFPGFDPKTLELSSPYPGSSPWSIDKQLPGNVYNPAKARALLQAAGYATTLGSGSNHIVLDYVTTTRTDRIKLSQILQRYWNQVGIGIKITYSAHPTGQNGIFGAWADGGLLDHHAYQIGEFAFLENPDPDEGSLNWLPDQINSPTCPNCANYGAINDPHLTSLLLQGRTTLDNAKRHAIYAQVQKYFYQQMLNISLYTVPAIVAVKGTIGNFKQTVTQAGNQWNAFQWFYDPTNSQKAILQ
ncbi:MAG TPA: ABC transporter substrate-binding protein [Chloroflexota bacterium]|nr:ABC transporter substrate-binding protein [Chloroflexota bacterium]